MLDKLNKQKLFVRLQAIFNIVLLIILIFYLCQVVVSEYLESHNSHENEPTLCWILWITITLVAIIIIPLQLTADMFLFKDMNDTLRSIQKYEQWLRISTLSIVVIVVALSLSLFCPLSPSSTGGFILMLITILSRFFGMYLVHKYKRALHEIVLETTTGILGNGSCRSISVSPDLIVISNYDENYFSSP